MKRTILNYLSKLACCGILGVLLTGCAWSIGEGKDRVTTTQTTKGQELIDLKKAKDQGALTEDEYENQRKQVLNR
jgi:hypothetical protein